MEKLPSVFVTPQDAVDVNQLTSLLLDRHGWDRSGSHSPFNVGKRCIIWLNIQAYCSDIDCGSVKDWKQQSVSVNELARQLELWA